MMMREHDDGLTIRYTVYEKTTKIVRFRLCPCEEFVEIVHVNRRKKKQTADRKIYNVYIICM